MSIAAVFKPWLLHTLPAAVGPTDMPHGIEGEAQGSTAAEDALGASCHLEIHGRCVLHPLGMCGDNYFNHRVTTVPPWFVFMLFKNAMYIWLYGGKSWFCGNQTMKPIRSITSATKKQGLNIKEIVLFYVKIHILSIFLRKRCHCNPKSYTFAPC